VQCMDQLRSLWEIKTVDIVLWEANSFGLCSAGNKSRDLIFIYENNLISFLPHSKRIALPLSDKSVNTVWEKIALPSKNCAKYIQ
jgi:hypothetical protein